MGLPELTFSLEKAAGTVSARMSAGAVALILRDAKDNGVYTIHRESDIPAQLGAANVTAIKRAMIGYINRPSVVYVAVIATACLLYTSSSPGTEAAIVSGSYKARWVWVIAQRAAFLLGRGNNVKVMPILWADSSARIHVSSKAEAGTPPERKDVQLPKDVYLAKEAKPDCQPGLSPVPDL